MRYGKTLGAEVVKHPLRRSILDFVAAHPGITSTRLVRKAQSAPGTVQYHVRILRRAKLLREVRSTRGYAYFTPAVEDSAIEVLIDLRRGCAFEAARQICRRGHVSQRELMAWVGIGRKALVGHLRPLIERGLVREFRCGRRLFYGCTEELTTPGYGLLESPIVQEQTASHAKSRLGEEADFSYSDRSNHKR